MAAEERWYFTKEQLISTPSRKCAVDPDRELSYRQQAANFIQDMGQRLQVNQLCINTSIVYMHRFYMFHSFTKFHRNAISTCALFLAAKVEEQPRKLEHVIKVAHMCLHRDAPPLDTKSEAYLEQAQELVINENIMLQTLGFDVAIDHPHTHVVKCCQLVRGVWPSAHQHHASKDLAQTSYFMATNSLHLTTMCLQYKPTVVACVCIHLACKWANWEIPKSSEGKRWFWYVEKAVTEELLEELTAEFVAILDRCPSRLKRKMMSSSSGMNDRLQDASLEKKLSTDFPHSSGSTSKTSSPSLPASAPSVSVKTEKYDRMPGSSSAMKANLAEKTDGPATSNVDKNGNLNTITPEWKERARKEHITPTSTISSSSMSMPPTGHSQQHSSSSAKGATSPRSPGRKLTAKGSASALSADSPPTLTSLDFTKSSLQSSSPTTPKKAKLDGSSSRGMTPKEYREYKERKKRERAEREKDKISVVKQTLPNSGGELERIERECVKGLGIGGRPLSSLNLQPVVSLTPLNLSNIAKLTAPKHSHSSAQHSQKQQQKATEKPPKSLPIGIAESVKSSNRHQRVHHQKGSADDKLVSRHHEGNHLGRNHRPPPAKLLAVSAESVPASPIVDSTPPPPPTTKLPSSASILTPSPPNIKEEEPVSKPFITQNTSSDSRVPSSDVCVPPVKSFFKIDHRKREKEEFRGSSHPLSEPPPPPRRHEMKDSKERLFKHHKSKTPPVAALSQTSEAIQPIVKQDPLPVTPVLTPSSLSPLSNAISAPVKLEIKLEPSRITSTSNVPPNLISNDNPIATNSCSPKDAKPLIIPQEKLHSTLQSVPDVPPAPANDKTQVKPVEEVPTPETPPTPPPPPPRPVPPTSSTSMAPEPPPPPLHVNEKNPLTVTLPHQPSKHERREKHRHKDRERSHDKKVEPSSTLATPSIKLTIPKERINLAASMGFHGNSPGNLETAKKVSSHSPKEKMSGGLKLKIPKDKLVTCSKAKAMNAPAPLMDNPPLPPLKITKDRLGSKGVYNLSVGLKEKPDREPKKREREQSAKSDLPSWNPDEDCKPSKILKQSSRSSRKSCEGSSPQVSNNPAVSILSPMDVPPSSNTRSSRHEQAPRHSNSDGHQHQHSMHHRGHKSSKHGGGGGMLRPPTFGHAHAMGMNAAGPFPFNAQYYPPFPQTHGVNYFNPPPMHRADFPPQFYSQFGPPPPHMHPPPHPGMPYPPPPMMPQRQMPPLPREPPPTIPPPPPE